MTEGNQEIRVWFIPQRYLPYNEPTLGELQPEGDLELFRVWNEFCAKLDLYQGELIEHSEVEFLLSLELSQEQKTAALRDASTRGWIIKFYKRDDGQPGSEVLLRKKLADE